MSKFFTADQHFCHANIIKYCNRPFQDNYGKPYEGKLDKSLRAVAIMNQTLVNNWNSVISNEDEVYQIGDFGFKGDSNSLIHIMKSLNGIIHFMPGSHDKETLRANSKCHRFESVQKELHIKIWDEEMGAEQVIIMNHCPFLTWEKSYWGSWNFFGHVHGKLNNTGRLSPNQIDVGVDCWDFTPPSYEQLKISITKQNMQTNEK